MGYFLTTISHNTTGTKSITVPAQPLGLRITTSKKTSVTQNFAHMSMGVSDGTNQVCDAFFQDTTVGSTQRSSTKIVSVLENSAGTVTEVCAAHVDNATAAWTATAVKYIVDTANVNYQFLVEVWY